MADIKQLKIGSSVYEFNGKYIQGTDGSAKTWEDITKLINAASLPLTVVETLPEASASTMSAIYLIKHEHTTGDTFDEYITLQDSTTKAYSWEKIGNTDVDLTGYVQKGVNYSASAKSSGEHTHTITGSVSVPTVTDTHKYLTASASGTDLDTTTQSVPTSVSVSATDSVLGANTKFNVTGGALTGATATTPAVIDTTKFSGGSLSGGGVSGGVYSGATPAQWSASVSNEGVLSFDFTANNIGSVSKVTYTSPTLTPAKFEDGFYTAGKEGTPGTVSAIEVSASGDNVTAVTGVTVGDSVNVIKSVSVKTQPTITLTANQTTSTGAIDYVSDVSTGTATATITGGTAASAGAHTHDVNVAK